MKNKIIKAIGIILISNLLMNSLMYGQSSYSVKITSGRMMTAPLTMVTGNEANKCVSWGYCTDEIEGGVGKSEATIVSGAIFVPKEICTLYKECQISKIRIGIEDAASDLSVFIVSTLGGEVLAEQKVGNVERGWHEVVLENPYTLKGEAIYVGYTSKGVQQVGLTAGYSPNGLWLGTNGEWADCSGEGWGVLAIQACIGGENMPDREMALKSVNKVYAKVNEPFTISGIVQNLTNKEAKNYTIGYKIANGEEIKQNFETHLLANEKDTFYIEAKTQEIGEFNLSVSITAVNGETDAFEGNNSAVNTLYSKEYLFPRKVVVEEGTGTWCQYCPIGIVGFREMNKKYPDTFIGIAAHTGGTDPMTVSSYSPLMNSFSGYPSCIVNRKKELVMEPFWQNLEAAYEIESIPADAGIKVIAAYSSEDKKGITVKTVTTFGYSETNATYRIAYVLTENNVQGKTSGYAQENAFAGGSRGVMGGFENLPSTIPPQDMVYNEVARGIYKTFSGTLHTVPTSIEKGIPYEFSYEIDLPKNIMDNNNVEVVTLLIDSKTGEIVNADKCKIEEESSIVDTWMPDIRVYGEKGHVKVEGDYDKFQVYTFNGMQVDETGLIPGIYLVQVVRGYSTKVMKVMIK